jgi:antitoxin component YwqK of YwqJK toxin-antitoxin module
MKTASHSRTIALTVVMSTVVFASSNLAVSRADDPPQIDSIKQIYAVPAPTNLQPISTEVASSDIQFPRSEIEIVQERYSNGKVKIERETTLDDKGNYVNHGTMKVWDINGKLVVEGNFNMGKRNGEWTCEYSRDTAKHLRRHPFIQFKAPFVAQVNYVDGTLQSKWTILDANQTKCSLVSLENGKRHGPVIDWLPSGDVYRQSNYQDGLLVGKVFQRSPQGELNIIAEYVDGRQIITKKTTFPNKRDIKTEATFLGPTLMTTSPDNFWNGQFAEYEPVGEEIKHGSWKTSYPNGQAQLEGYFEQDKEDGMFTWWHSNGQKAVQGKYRDGLQHGEWIWWHENGQKATVGGYQYGVQSGLWRKWDPNGRLEKKMACKDEKMETLARGGLDDMSNQAELKLTEPKIRAAEVKPQNKFPALPWMTR